MRAGRRPEGVFVQGRAASACAVAFLRYTFVDF
jgi:hypothetical protein